MNFMQKNKNVIHRVVPAVMTICLFCNSILPVCAQTNNWKSADTYSKKSRLSQTGYSLVESVSNGIYNSHYLDKNKIDKDFGNVVYDSIWEVIPEEEIPDYVKNVNVKTTISVNDTYVSNGLSKFIQDTDVDENTSSDIELAKIDNNCDDDVKTDDTNVNLPSDNNNYQDETSQIALQDESLEDVPQTENITENEQSTTVIINEDGIPEPATSDTESMLAENESVDDKTYNKEDYTLYVVGVNEGPSGHETYYNLNMDKIIQMMRNRGYSEADGWNYWVREDGVKMFGNYVIAAANLDIRPRGSFIETSVGMAIVCDTGDFAKSNIYGVDIATTW